MATLTTLVSFNDATGVNPEGGLIADANGDLFGTASEGGARDAGTVFEVTKTASGYASTPTVLASFSGTDGDFPGSSLLADANGDLFGTTPQGGTNANGAVSEIAIPRPATSARPSRRFPLRLLSLERTLGLP